MSNSYLESRTQNSASIVREWGIGNREQLKETWARKLGGGGKAEKNDRGGD